MPRIQASVAQARQILSEFKREAKKNLAATSEKVVRPSRLQAHADGATRTGQVVSLFFLGPIILVCLQLILVVNNLLADVLSGGMIEETEMLGVVSFLVTFLTLGLLIMVAWGWFQFVRTAGFGAFSDD